MPVSPLRRLAGGRKPNATSASPARSPSKCRNRLELADLGRLHARMLLDRGGTGDHERAAEMLQETLSAYRTFGMPAYAAEAERLQRLAGL